MADVHNQLDYTNSFWGEKHHGYHVMYENMKRGEETVNEVSQFLKERLLMEEEYGKMLGKSVNRLSLFINNGSCLDTGWSLTKGTLEILVDVQTMMVKNLQDLAREVSKYKDDVVKGRKEAKQQDVIDAVNLMQTTTTCLQKAKETYHSRCAELEKLNKETNPNPKEITKVESKVSKSRDEYKLYVDKYELVRHDFEEKMEKACRLFQNHDRSHFAILQQYLMMYASHHQETSSSTQQVCCQLRESIQQLSVDDVISRFVRERSTGTERPQPAQFEEPEGLSSSLAKDVIPSQNNDVISTPNIPISLHSGASSCSSSNVVQFNSPPSTIPDLLTLDALGLDAWNEKKNSITQGSTVQPPPQSSPTISQSSDSIAGVAPSATSSLFSSSIGGTKKLSMFLPKRKKTISQSSIGPEENGDTQGGGLFKFRQNRRSKKSTSDLTSVGTGLGEKAAAGDQISMDDAQSTASSSRSEDKVNGSVHLLDSLLGGASTPSDAPHANATVVDDEGYTIPTNRDDAKIGGTGEMENDTNWSSCSSDEEDENEMQQSKIRTLTIRPAESTRAMNASVDELRDAIGHITIGRSSTFEKDPWSLSNPSNKPPLFSQSLSGGSLKPLRPAHTADGRFRSNFSESEFQRSNVPLNFSASCGPVAGMARARPRSNTPTHNSTFALATQNHNSTSTGNRENTGSQDWGSSFAMGRSDSHQSIGESTFNLSQSTANLMQATISEQRVPVAMAINEYSHVWFKGADTSQRTVRVFGTVMISFASSSLPLLTDVHSDMEQLQFRLQDAAQIKAVLPNKQLLLPSSVAHPSPNDVIRFQFDRLGLANWLLSQQKERPETAFYNAEVIRYEVVPSESGESPAEPPLLFTSYWKCENEHTDVRIDYRLNPSSPLTCPLLNITFSTKVSGAVTSVTSEPSASWDKDNSSLSWTVTELSRYGDCSGSLKARLHLDGTQPPSEPVHTHVQFQCSDVTLSNMSLSLEPSDSYHLSMIRRKVLSGKYFCEPEVRK